MSKRIYIDFLDTLSRDLLRPRIYTALYIVWCAYYITAGYIESKFPGSYGISEIFISYAGGYIRRGLLGQILYEICPYVNLRVGVYFLYAGMFSLLVYTSYKQISQRFDLITTLALFLSPALFLFHVNDKGVFIRKDVFIELLIFAMCAFACRGVQQKLSLAKATAAFILLYVLAFLLHEMALVYMPLPFLLLGIAYARNQRLLRWFLLGCALVAVSLGAVVCFEGTAEQRDAIVAAWQVFYPQFTASNNALAYIGLNVKDISDATVQITHADMVNMRSLIWGAFLALLPVGFVCAGYGVFRNVKTTFSSPLLWVLFWPAVFLPWAMPFFFNDFGRHISVGCLTYVFFFVSLQQISPQPPAPWLQGWNAKLWTSLRCRLLTLGGLLAYGTTWVLMHYAHPGTPYVKSAGLLTFLKYLP